MYIRHISLIISIVCFALGACHPKENVVTQIEGDVETKTAPVPDKKPDVLGIDDEQIRQQRASEVIAEPRHEVAGEFYNMPVSLTNYYFAKKAVLTFDARWRGVPQTAEELEELVWQELLFSFEAFKRNIEVSDEEIDAEIKKLLEAQKVVFDHTKDTSAFEEWAKEKLGLSIEAFRNQVEHLIKLEKLRNEVLNSFDPPVTEAEAYRKFRDEHNTLSVELVEFEDLDEAKRFYEGVKKNPKAWDTRKEKDPDSFKRPGFVALDFLIHMWGFKRNDAYRMMDMNIEGIYPPAPIYRDYAVFKILEKRPAQDSVFGERKEHYFQRVKTKKQYEEYKKWVEQLKKDANIKPFIK